MSTSTGKSEKAEKQPVGVPSSAVEKPDISGMIIHIYFNYKEFIKKHLFRIRRQNRILEKSVRVVNFK